ncbi:VOC family protein [Oceanobacillus sp. 1P07AA]|uniref:VOC family protein n=1 Tax=Oceanobacillus sp. 1P07AA TaxID=3132293 RepID=UPI0039A6A905
MAKVIGFEISSQDPERAIEFYKLVFGWEVEDSNWDYWSIIPETTGEFDAFVGGISKGPSDFPHGTRIQIEVDSIEETLNLAIQHQALILREKMEFDSYYLAYLVDPTGIGIGLIELKR